jgi:hypothetical protein
MTMATYAAGATVERRYPGPDADAARAAAGPQIAAFIEAGFTILSERWIDDSAGNAAPIGDAIASGPLTYLTAKGGSLSITYEASRPTDLPAAMPAYTMQDPRAADLATWSQLRVAGSVVAGIIFVLFFLFVLSQMMSMQSQMPAPFAP